MNFLDLASDVIDLRSFSSIWYWILLAIMWSTLSSYAMGVPSDVVARARRGDAQSIADSYALAQIYVDRTLSIAEASASLMVAVTGFVLTALGLLGFVYDVEICQALFLLFFPMMLVVLLSVLTAQSLRASGYENLVETLRWFRLKVQLLGTLFIFITALWGMWVNLSLRFY